MMITMYRLLLRLWHRLDLAKNSQIKILRTINDQFLIGVTGVIFNAEQEVLLVKHSYRRVPWSLPGGYLQAGEHPKEGLKREIYEETHFTVRIEKIIKTQHDEETARLDMCYIGTFEKGTFKKSHEVIDAGFFALNELPPLIDDQYKQIALAGKRYKVLHPQTIVNRLRRVFPFWK